jgi:hypothetical protein
VPTSILDRYGVLSTVGAIKYLVHSARAGGFRRARARCKRRGLGASVTNECVPALYGYQTKERLYLYYVTLLRILRT